MNPASNSVLWELVHPAIGPCQDVRRLAAFVGNGEETHVQ